MNVKRRKTLIRSVNRFLLFQVQSVDVAAFNKI